MDPGTVRYLLVARRLSPRAMARPGVNSSLRAQDTSKAGGSLIPIGYTPNVRHVFRGRIRCFVFPQIWTNMAVLLNYNVTLFIKELKKILRISSVFLISG